MTVAALRDVAVTFGELRAIDRVSLTIGGGEILGIVGESGSGKSVTALTLMGLIGFSGGTLAEGRVEIGGCDMTQMTNAGWRGVRGRRVGMIFQEPMTSLNPLLNIGAQLREALTRGPPAAEHWRARAIGLLDAVQITRAADRLTQYPHEMSGGMRQRIMIAMVLAQSPDLIIADEATTALDVTVQKEIIDLLRGLRAERGMSVLFISHDLALVSEFCDRVLVMYGGRIIEEALAARIFAAPRHPYTSRLLHARPHLASDDDLAMPAHARKRLVEIAAGPLPRDASQICRFLPRCPECVARCAILPPPWSTAGSGGALCWVA
jgi:oligopeptide/dipeptide ABC transporter ATP-binding protein